MRSQAVSLCLILSRGTVLSLSIGFVEWAKEQVEAYAEMFRKQVYSSDVDTPTVEEAKKITHIHSKKVCQSLIKLSTHSSFL